MAAPAGEGSAARGEGAGAGRPQGAEGMREARGGGNRRALNERDRLRRGRCLVTTKLPQDAVRRKFRCPGEEELPSARTGRLPADNASAMDRRHFLVSSLAAAGAVSVRAAAPAAAAGLIDTNVTLAHWAVRRSYVETTAALVAKLRRHGVVQAWTGSYDAVLHTDLAGANARLAATCAAEGEGVLLPFGTVNPLFPDWADDLRRCHEDHRMPGLRLYPGYHGYTLESPEFAALLAAAAARGLLVQIALTIEDERSQNPALTAPYVTAAPLPELVRRIPGARVQVLNATSRLLGPTNPLLARFAAAGLGVELATLEGVAGAEGLLRKHPALRLCFGSHSPYFYFESALLKLQESALSPAELAAVRGGHARTLLARA